MLWSMAPPTGGAECINAKKCNVMSLEVEVHKEQSVYFLINHTTMSISISPLYWKHTNKYNIKSSTDKHKTQYISYILHLIKSY